MRTEQTWGDSAFTMWSRNIFIMFGNDFKKIVPTLVGASNRQCVKLDSCYAYHEVHVGVS